MTDTAYTEPAWRRFDSADDAFLFKWTTAAIRKDFRSREWLLGRAPSHPSALVGK